MPFYLSFFLESFVFKIPCFSILVLSTSPAALFLARKFHMKAISTVLQSKWRCMKIVDGLEERHVDVVERKNENGFGGSGD